MTRNDTSKASTAPPFDYSSLNVLAADRKKLEQTAADVALLGRKTTDQAFELGAHLTRVAEILTSDKTLGIWVETFCGFTARTGRLYASVYRQLEPRRAKLVELGVAPTVLFELTKADEAQFKRVLQLAEETGRIKVSDVKGILGGSAEDSATISEDPFETGGIAGLKALIAFKTRMTLGSFLKRLGEIQLAITSARKGKRLYKGKLIEVVEANARIAHLELLSLIQFVAPAMLGKDSDFQGMKKGSPWAKVRDVLQTLSSNGAWPESEKLDGWLEREVLPAFEWATSKSAAPEWSVEPPTTVLPFRPIAVDQESARPLTGASDEVDPEDEADDDFEADDQADDVASVSLAL